MSAAPQLSVLAAHATEVVEKDGLKMADATENGDMGPDRAPIASRELVLAKAARNAGPPLLFGLRLWAAVCLATYVAFWLELDNAYWAPVSAALVCQPHLGASLRKGWFRMIGTVIGAVAIVVLTACFPQDRFGFLVSLALWGGVCAFVATLAGASAPSHDAPGERGIADLGNHLLVCWADRIELLPLSAMPVTFHRAKPRPAAIRPSSRWRKYDAIVSAPKRHSSPEIAPD